MFTYRIIHALCILSTYQASVESGSPQKYWETQSPRALKVCKKVAFRSLEEGLNPLETISLSFIETRHNDKLRGAAGELGPLQALPKYWKRKGDKDSLEAGLRAWKYYSNKSSTIEEAAGRYNGSGRHGRHAKALREHYTKLDKLYRILRFPL